MTDEEWCVTLAYGKSIDKKIVYALIVFVLCVCVCDNNNFTEIGIIVIQEEYYCIIRHASWETFLLYEGCYINSLVRKKIKIWGGVLPLNMES